MKYFIYLILCIFTNIFPMTDPAECYTYEIMPSEKNWSILYKTHKSEITNATIAGKKFQETWETTNFTCYKPTNFLFGLSSSAYQIEGGLDKYNAIAHFYNQQGLQTAEDAIDFWHKYKDDIQQMKKELGINSFRLSIAWDRIEPNQGFYDQSAIDIYKDIIQTLKYHDIEPIITLHHYTIPQWFATIGGFEKQTNIHHFVSFAKKMYQELCYNVQYWSTFNAPEAYAIKGYAKGDAAPGYLGKWQLVQQVLINMLNAHVQIYQDIKGANGLYNLLSILDNTIPKPLIGIQKNIILLDASYKNMIQTCLSPVSDICCLFGDVLQSKGFYSFFSTGTFSINIPFMVNINYTNSLAPASLDWIGLNFYSNMKMFISKPQVETLPKRMTENPIYRNYPEGIARAVQEIYTNIAAPLNIPILITENGIATNIQEEKKREKFFQRTLFTIRTLIKEGYPIIGYLPWSSHDSYEWPTKEFPNAFTGRHYGFFRVNFDQESPNYLKRTLKQSSYYYRNFIKAYNTFKTAD